MDNMPSNLIKLQQNIISLKEKINIYKDAFTEINTDLNKIENNFNNYIKNISKPKQNTKKGFAKPTNISPELAHFLNIDENTKISRTDVTKLLSKYIKDNNLQNSLDKREIIPNDELSRIINIDKNEKVTFFSIQKLLNKHFIKS
jgi:chromatin remodeling complex protein RSC6